MKVQRVSERATEFKRLRPRTRLPLTSVIEEEAEKKRRIINYLLLLLLLLQRFLVSVAAAAAKANFCANRRRKIQSQGESPTTTKVASEMKVICCCCCCCCCPQNTLRQHCAAQSAVHSGRHSANFRTHATFMECHRQQQRQRCPLCGAAICNFRWKIRRGEGNHCKCVLATCCAQTCLQRVCVSEWGF